MKCARPTLNQEQALKNQLIAFCTSAMVASLSLACGGNPDELAAPENPELSDGIEGASKDLGVHQDALGAVSTLAYEWPMDLVSSTGNLYWTSFSIDEFGPNSATVYRASKFNTPGAERILWRESGDQASHY